MKIKIGDVVKVKEGVVTRASGGEIVSVSTDEVFSVTDITEYSAQIKSLKRGFKFWIGKSFVEVGVKRELSPKKTPSEAGLNEGKGKMPRGTVVKIGVNELADAQEWARSNDYDIELNSDEHYAVKMETTKTVFIESNGRKGFVRLPKRFLEKVAPEQIRLNEQDILTLIDIAIDTGDEEWFNELHSKLNTL